MINCRKPDIIMKGPFWLAGVRFYVAGGTCVRKQSSTIWEGEIMKKCFRMGITVLKIVIWRGKLPVLWSQIAFYGSAVATL